MSFFYGVNATTPDTNSTRSPFDKTILPGHNFKNPYMTGIIAIIAFTIVALGCIHYFTSKIKVPKDPLPPNATKSQIKYGMGHPTSGIWLFCWAYILSVLVSLSPKKNLPTYLVLPIANLTPSHSYLVLELVTRICVELRLKVPYVFIAIEVPTRFFLMFADIWVVIMVSGSNVFNMRWRLNLNKDFLHYLGGMFMYIACFALFMVLFLERIAYTVMMVKQGFRWAKPDERYYAISRTVFTGAYLLMCLIVLGSAVRVWIVYRMRRRDSGWFDRCGNVRCPSFLYLLP